MHDQIEQGFEAVPRYSDKLGTSMPRMTIGELARRAGVGVETVRYYQRRGLFPEPPRQPRGFREYPNEALELLRFIRRARGLGFTLREIERLLALRKSKKDSNEVAEMLTAKAADVEKQIRALERVVTTLGDLATRVEAAAPEERFRVLEEDATPST